LLFVEGLRFVGETSSSESWSGGFAIFWKYANSSVSRLNGKKAEIECVRGHTYNPSRLSDYQATIARRGGKTRMSSNGICMYECMYAAESKETNG
jgi:hypothetical protein